MMYHVIGFCPRTDIHLGRCGFGIKLYPAWAEAVKSSGITQNNVQTAIKSYHRAWLDGFGYDAIYDPENSGFQKDEKKKPGPNARPLYDIYSIRVSWGEWGPEHITVPGNACGLDIDSSLGSPRDGRTLQPHNVDSISQMGLILAIFTTFADHIIGGLEYSEMKGCQNER